jgi:ABC-2 type transport system ATP-binding protein
MERLRQRATIFYSTHILEDVQRVSDRVVILNQGRLISQGPIEDLLVGDEGSVYTLQTTGDPAKAQARLSSQPWVSSLQINRVDGIVDWRVVVTDEQAAQSQLLRLILESPETDVLEYGRQKYELEKIFVHLVGGE